VHPSASRRLLKLGGRTAFFRSTVAPGLSGKVHRPAVRLRPRAVASTLPLDALMGAAGYDALDIMNVTPDFITTGPRTG
jgi:hypothetical protein